MRLKLVAALLFISMFATHMAFAASCDPPRDKRGRIQRSIKQIKAFKSTHACPSTGRASAKGKCPGYVIDHIKPLCACGADAPDNMQWQSIEDAKIKDQQERALCGGD